VSRSAIVGGETRLADLLTEPIAAIFPSKGEFRKMVQGGGVSINKEKVTDPNAMASADMLLDEKYILVQRGKKNFFLIKAE
jgi:tyrosyl-tRNA synthetase